MNKSWELILAAYYLADDSVKAFNKLREAIAIADIINNTRLIEKAIGIKGEIYFKLGMYDQALKYIHQAIDIGEKQLKKNDNDQWFYDISLVMEYQSKHSDALDALRKAEDYSKKNIKIYTLYKIHLERSSIYFRLNQFELALLSLNRAQEYAEKLDLGGIKLARIYERYGDLYRVWIQIPLAIDYYSKALELETDEDPDDSPKAYIFNKMGSIYHSIGECKKARECYSKALYFANQKSVTYRVAYTLINLSLCQIDLGEYDQAKSNLEKISTFRQNKVDLHIYVSQYELLGDIFLNTGNQDSAIYYYKKAITTSEIERKKITIDNLRIGSFKSRPQLYLKLAGIYKNSYMEGEKTSADSLFKYVNMSRSRTLIDEGKTQIQKPDSIYQNTVNRFKHTQRNLRMALGDSVFQMENLPSLRYDLLTRKMETIQDRIQFSKTLPISHFQQYLKKQSAGALIYCINKRDSYALYVCADSLLIVDLMVDPDTLQQSINNFVKCSFYTSDLKKNHFNAQSAYSLYRQLWLPVEKKVNLPQNIIIVPDVSILSLPFDVLLTHQTDDSIYRVDDEPNYREYFLVQKYNIGYLPSTFVLTSFNVKAENDNFLAIANPFFSNEQKIDPKIRMRTGWDFEPLIFSKAEVNKIAPLFENKEILEGKQATKQNFVSKLPNSNIIHLATHAFVDTVFDAFSGLVFSLSSDSLDDGLLMGYEIDRLKLNSDLLVLSACESGQGRIVNGEGIMGMPRLFFNAGVRTVLMALWKVDDKIASEMMPVFYKNLFENGMTKMEALGETKRSIINSNSLQKYAYPFYWASFNLFGDTGSISKQDSSNTTLYIFVFVSLLIMVLILRKYHR